MQRLETIWSLALPSYKAAQEPRPTEILNARISPALLNSFVLIHRLNRRIGEPQTLLTMTTSTSNTIRLHRVLKASAEKIYRAEGAGAEVAVRLVIETSAALVWAPQETLLFDRARLSRRLEADVAADASLLVVEASVFGRLAHGETRIDAALRDDWRIRREGRLIFAEAVRLASEALMNHADELVADTAR